MKKYLLNSKKALIIALFSAINLFGFSEGVDYVKLKSKLPVENDTLIKVFSYACPFCYKYDKSITPKVFEKTKNLKYEPFHLKTKGEFGETTSKILAVLIAIDEKNGVELLDDKSKFKKAKFEIYRSLHDKKQKWSDKQAFIKQILKSADISEDEYNNMLETTKVQKILKKWDMAYDIAKIQGVPAFVVNGKYLIYTQNIKSIDEMVKLIEFLQKK